MYENQRLNTRPSRTVLAPLHASRPNGPETADMVSAVLALSLQNPSRASAVQTVTIGVPYRTDARGSAHTGYDLKAVAGMSALRAEVSVRGKTLPPGAETSGADSPVRPTDANVVRSHLSDVDALMIPGAPVANDTQTASSRGIPKDALYNKADQARSNNRERIVNEHRSRSDYEVALIEQARNLGMPVIAVCAGSWRLLQGYGGAVETLPASERQVHTSKNDVWGLRHAVSVTPGSHLADMLASGRADAAGAAGILAPVTSTHWAAAAESEPGKLRTAPQPDAAVVRKPDDILSIAARTEDEKSGSVEAFEARAGAPVFGIQWHPETHLPGMPGEFTGSGDIDPAAGASRALFGHLVQAAQSYRHRRRLREEFISGHYSGTPDPLR